MNTTYDFVAAICAEPDDDSLRLIYADWLDENAGPLERPCPMCSAYTAHPGNPWKGMPGYRPEPDPASGRHEGGWSNCKTCNSGGRDYIRAGVVRVPDGRAARAEFIRVGCEIAKLKWLDDAPSSLQCPLGYDGTMALCRLDAIRRRERALIGKHGHEWAGPALPFRGEFRRGFVAEITLPAEAFCGGVCGRCEGDGQAHGSDRPFEWSDDPLYMKCPVCKGDKRTPGVAATLFKACPVERVTLSDKSPAVIASGLYVWWFRPGRTPHSVAFSAPPELKPFLNGEAFHQFRSNARGLSYPTPETAHAAMSAACVAFGRDAAGLK